MLSLRTLRGSGCSLLVEREGVERDRGRSTESRNRRENGWERRGWWTVRFHEKGRGGGGQENEGGESALGEKGGRGREEEDASAEGEFAPEPQNCGKFWKKVKNL